MLFVRKKRVFTSSEGSTLGGRLWHTNKRISRHKMDSSPGGSLVIRREQAHGNVPCQRMSPWAQDPWQWLMQSPMWSSQLHCCAPGDTHQRFSGSVMFLEDVTNRLMSHAHINNTACSDILKEQFKTNSSPLYFPYLSTERRKRIKKINPLQVGPEETTHP